MLVNIFGKRGAGKTHMIKHALKYCEPPVAVLDILGNFNEDEVPISYQTDSLSDACEQIKNYNVYEAASDNERAFMDEVPPIIVLQPADPDTAIDFISATLWHEFGGTLVIDEADGFSITEAPCFDQLIRYGRNRGVHLLTGCRRPYELNRSITAGANCIYIFQTQEPRDIEYFAKTLIGKDQADRLKNLPEYHGLFINYDKKTIGMFKTGHKGEVYILEEKQISSGNNATTENKVRD